MTVVGIFLLGWSPLIVFGLYLAAEMLIAKRSNSLV
jgi:hypothetical protein